MDFENFELPDNNAVENGKSLRAVGKGTIKILTFVNEKKQIKFLEKVRSRDQ